MYLGIHAVKNTTICQMVSLCNIQHYVMYNYIFRPCKWAIIRLFVEPEGWVCNRSLEGGGRDFVLHLKLLRNKTCPPPNSYCTVTLLVLRTTWWWPIYKAETCSLYITECCILHSDTIWQIVVFLTACICKYTHNTLYCWPKTTGDDTP